MTKKFSTVMSVGFTVEHNEENTEDIPREVLMESMEKRVRYLRRADDWKEAYGVESTTEHTPADVGHYAAGIAYAGVHILVYRALRGRAHPYEHQPELAGQIPTMLHLGLLEEDLDHDGPVRGVSSAGIALVRRMGSATELPLEDLCLLLRLSRWGDGEDFFEPDFDRALDNLQDRGLITRDWMLKDGGEVAVGVSTSILESHVASRIIKSWEVGDA